MTNRTDPGGHRRRDLLYRPGAMPQLFGDTASVLIVDDDPVAARFLDDVLTPEGYRCTLAAGPAEAREHLDAHEFAIALIDVLMPGESGLELTDHALEQHPHLAVVMVTGVDDPAIADLALRTGAYGYLVKPVSPNEVVVAVTNAGRRRCLEIQSASYRRHLEERLGLRAGAEGLIDLDADEGDRAPAGTD